MLTLVLHFQNYLQNAPIEEVRVGIMTRQDSFERSPLSEEDIQRRIRYFLVGETQRISELPAVLFKIISRACHGSDEDQFTLGFLLDRGPTSLPYIPPEAFRFIIQSVDEALYWYGLAAEQGNIAALFNIGVLYLRDASSLDGSVKSSKIPNRAEALRHFLMAGDDSSAEEVEFNKETISQSLFYAGMIILLYMPEYSVREQKEGSSKDEKRQSKFVLAAKYLEKASRYGNQKAEAMYAAALLAQSLEDPDSAKSKQDMRKGTSTLTAIYESAVDTQEKAEFFKWDPVLLHNMAVIYAKGLAVKIDSEKAKDLLIQAGEGAILEGRSKDIPSNLKIKFYKV
jgi:TPR repeat protein